MMLSGRSLFHLPSLGPDSPSFPASLRAAGYDTYHHGKRGNTPHAIQERFERNRYLANDEKERRSGYPGREIADEAVRYLRGRRGGADRPFFMYLAFANPHDPRVVNDEDRRRYDESTMPLPRNYRPLHPFDNGELTVRDEALAPWPRTPEVVRKHLTDYYGVITHLDTEIGRILGALRESGEFDRTLIVFSSDHGLAVGSHGLFGKQNLYEDGMKVPLILSGPGVPKGSSEALVYLQDLFPTVCALAGLPVPAGLDGKSLAPVIRGEAPSVRDAVFLAYRSVQRAVRQGDWKLIRYPQINVTQLFNLRDDPAETNDLVSDPRQAGRVEAMMGRLRQLQQEAGDTLPLTSEHPRPAKAELPPAPSKK
jgi:arylsulfatase A-like enzyme